MVEEIKKEEIKKLEKARREIFDVEIIHRKEMQGEKPFYQSEVVGNLFLAREAINAAIDYLKGRKPVVDPRFKGV